MTSSLTSSSSSKKQPRQQKKQRAMRSEAKTSSSSAAAAAKASAKSWKKSKKAATKRVVGNVGGSRSGNNGGTTLRFEDGAVQFRQRIAASILSNRPLLLRNIRVDGGIGSSPGSSPGLRRHEVSFLRLVDKMTNGSVVEINSTGTQLRFVPGILLGGDIRHDCPVGRGEGGDDDDDDDDDDVSSLSSSSARSVGWFLEGVLPLGCFGKEPLNLTLTGITDGTCHVDPSPDYLRSSALPLLSKFGVGDDGGADGVGSDALSSQPPQIRVTRRGGYPSGGGSAVFYCPIVRKQLRPIDLTEGYDGGGDNDNKVKRIRGVARSTKLVSSSTCARVAYGCKGLLQRLIPDVWIHTDVHTTKQHGCGPDPTVSLVLTAETTNGAVVLSTECCWMRRRGSKGNESGGGGGRELPEDMGVRGAAMMLEEVRKGGCVDSGMQSLALLFMCLTPEDVSRIRLGTLSQYAVQSLRLYKLSFGVEFKIRPDHDDRTVLLSCLGTGYRNMARSST